MFDRSAYYLVALGIALVIASAARAQLPFFTGLGDLPGGGFFSAADDISADGAVVVGRSNNDAFRWTRETGMTGLGIHSGWTPKVSAEGSTIVGQQLIGTSNTLQSYRWTNTEGVISLPLGPGYLRPSGDGTIIVGLVEPERFNSQAARWTEAGGVEVLHSLTMGLDFISAIDVSADGSIIYGVGRKAGIYVPVLWNAADGVVPLEMPSPATPDIADVIELSDDGKVAIGLMTDDGGITRRGFRWTKDTGVVEVGRLPDGPWMSATGVSADGSIIVGNSQDLNPRRPAIWDAVHGARYLDDILANELNLGSAMTGWTRLLARGVSGDGRSVIGDGTNPNGNPEAWIAYLGPAGLAGDFNKDGIVDAADYIVWRNGLGTTYTQTDYDTWRAHFGQSAGNGSITSSPVPEPATFALLVMAVASQFLRRRRSARLL